MNRWFSQIFIIVILFMATVLITRNICVYRAQNACVRFIFGLRKYDHISHRFLDLNWLRMDQRRLLYFSTFLVKILNDPESPDSIRERLLPRHGVHSVNVRNTDRLTLPHHPTALFQRSCTYNAVMIYNGPLAWFIF